MKLIFAQDGYEFNSVEGKLVSERVLALGAQTMVDLEPGTKSFDQMSLLLTMASEFNLQALRLESVAAYQEWRPGLASQELLLQAPSQSSSSL